MARTQSVKQALKLQQAKDLDFFGFVCPACNFRLRLSDRHVSECIVDLLMNEVGFSCLECTECGHEQQYSQEDLLMFLPGGRQSPVGTRLSSKGMRKIRHERFEVHSHTRKPSQGTSL